MVDKKNEIFNRWQLYKKLYYINLRSFYQILDLLILKFSISKNSRSLKFHLNTKMKNIICLIKSLTKNLRQV